jgi:hypothetical protein
MPHRKEEDDRTLPAGLELAGEPEKPGWLNATQDTRTTTAATSAPDT